jgi:hypothetical protein
LIYSAATIGILTRFLGQVHLVRRQGDQQGSHVRERLDPIALALARMLNVMRLARLTPPGVAERLRRAWAQQGTGMIWPVDSKTTDSYAP